MDGLVNLLYGEKGILYKVESGNESDVHEHDKELLVKYAELANKRFKENTITKEEMMIFIDVMDAFSSFQNVDWIREITTDIHSALTRGINFIKTEE